MNLSELVKTNKVGDTIGLEILKVSAVGFLKPNEYQVITFFNVYSFLGQKQNVVSPQDSAYIEWTDRNNIRYWDKYSISSYQVGKNMSQLVIIPDTLQLINYLQSQKLRFEFFNSYVHTIEGKDLKTLKHFIRSNCNYEQK